MPQSIQRWFGRSRAAGALFAGASAAVLGGCGWSDGDSTPRIAAVTPDNPESLSPSDFVLAGVHGGADRPHTPATGANEPGESDNPGEPVVLTADRPGLVRGVTPDGRELWGVGGRSPVGTLTASGEPVAGAVNPGAVPVEPATLVDAKVGDINGRPIYAGEFLAPLAARLEAEARRQNNARSWMRFARELIERELDALIEDELLRAEAIASLSPEQRQGLAFFLEQLRSNVVSRTGGSSIAASERIQRETGMGVEEFLDEQRTRELIEFQLNQAVNNRVNVPWRDVVLEYERQWEQFNPPARAQFTMLRVPTRRAEAVDEIRARVEAGEDWSEIAVTSSNNHARDTQGRVDPPLEFRGEYGEAELFSSEVLNDAARSLEAGSWAGPLEVGSQSMWIRLDGIEQESVPLYLAQLRIERWLRQVREAEERGRYIERLRGDARVSNTEEIIDRLMAVATERHGPGAMAGG